MTTKLKRRFLVDDQDSCWGAPPEGSSKNSTMCSNPSFQGETVRQIAVGFVASILVIAGGAGVFGVDPGNDAMTARVEQLIKQLGDDSFAKREAASRELETIGEPALPALRKSADTDRDPEIRCRARRVVETLAARASARELAKWVGYWKTADGVWLQIDGQRWSARTPTWG